MTNLSRRAFFGWLAAAIPAATFVRRAHAAAVRDLMSDSRMLRAIGEVVLPAELGNGSTAAVVDRFQKWVAGYREGAELVHGYGTSKIDYSGPTPQTRWASQLDRLNRTGRTAHGKPFAELPLALRRDIVRDELGALKVDRLPSVGRAPHVALALLAHYYASPEATDRCYGVQIGKHTCRPLGAQVRRPLPLAQGGA